MRLHTTLRAIARPRPLIFGLALGVAAALPAAAYAQDGGALTQEELTVQAPPDAADAPAEAVDPAEAGDLVSGDTEVRALQDTLKDLGYFYGPADGRKGPRTRTALRNFQRDQGLAVSGSFDRPTLDRIKDQSKLARTEHRPAASETLPPAQPVATATRPRRSGGALAPVSDAIVGGLKNTPKGAYTGVKATGDGLATAGKATGDGFATAGRATAKAGVVTAQASAIAAKSVVNAGALAYTKSRDLIVGDRGGKGERGDDENIRKSIERQYAQEDRVVPGEVDVRVSGGNVTLALPDGARTDVPRAVRLAKLTPGVRSVTTVTTSVRETNEQ